LLLSLTTSAAAVVPAIVAQNNTTPAPVEAKSDVHIPKRFEDVKSADYGSMSDPKNVQKFVTDYFSDIPLLAQVAACESHNRQFNSSGNVQRGEVNHYDVGIMQVNELYHLETATKLGYDLYTADGNVAYARYLYEKEGAKPWISSSACWAKFQDSNIAKK
jgi:hypothetical protein